MSVDVLKEVVINLKSMSQEIPDPILGGGGDGNGYVLKIIFTQEAWEQFTPTTKVYLRWKHEQTGVRGYNIFSHISIDNDKYETIYKLQIPAQLLVTGDVNCRIDVVDNVSLIPSNNFRIHVLEDIYDEEDYEEIEADPTFAEALIAVNKALEEVATYSDSIAQLQEFAANAEVDIQENKDKIANLETAVAENQATLINHEERIAAIEEIIPTLETAIDEASHKYDNSFDDILDRLSDLEDKVEALSLQVSILIPNYIKVKEG